MPEAKEKSADKPTDGGQSIPPQERPQVQVDASKTSALYANFCRVAGAPEEVIIDFGLNPQPNAIPTEPIVISQRVVVNYYTAKRLLQVLHMTIQQHESAFGVLELDVRKRISGGKQS